MAKAQAKNGERGFSLIELMISLVVMMVVLGILSGIISGVQIEYKRQRVQMEAISSAQTALDNISRIVRMAGTKGVQCASTFQPQALTPGSQNADGSYATLAVQADWNPEDCQLTGIDENVTISAQSGNFYLDAARANPFVDKIAAVRFRFYDGANQIIADAVTNKQKIKYIRIEVDAQMADATVTTLRTGIQIRKE
jgi:Tfp pilus assembly protein PilW